MELKPTPQESGKIIYLSDLILENLSNVRPEPSPFITLSAISDSLIYICHSLRLDKKEFKDVCQQLVDQYEETFSDEEETK